MRKTLSISINPRIVNKNIHGDIKAFAEGWDPHECTLKQLADAVNHGFAFSAQFSGGIRKTANFLCSSFLAADIDERLTLQEALVHPFVVQHGSLIYTTPSHQKDGIDHFRIVFSTPYMIDSPDIWSSALVGLAETLGSDTSAPMGRTCSMVRTGPAPHSLVVNFPRRHWPTLFNWYQN